MQLCARHLVALLFLFSAISHAADNEIVFSTAPTHSKEDTIKLYTPLMAHLSQVTGKTFVIDPAANFIEYSVRLRLNKYDMLFDGPHLSGWRIVNREHLPITRLPGTIRIVVVAHKDSPLTSLQDLEGGYARVCAFASPNMLTMAFLSYFPNPVRQPNLIRTQGFKELVSCLKSGHGEAAVLRDTQWTKMSDEDKADLKLIASPERGYPERTFTVGPTIDATLRKQIADALLSEEGQKVSQPILERFNKKNFIPAKATDYAGLDLLLSPVWGFHSR
ncbi:MAG: phosphate/phosphite/phosphonate ABC transporter substrate-binding protein [Gammaproteobacteria bacterium]|nr:phosphate/phosphite/phosphonate ABC transporter substrate-binding protein [Gammaproteobacteria bacterium]